MKHTPGPWKIGRFISVKGSPTALPFGAIPIESEDVDGIQVCLIECDNPAAACEMEFADARLIAAAPELLAALKMLYQHSPPPKDGDAAYAFAIAEASLAIKKAEE